MGNEPLAVTDVLLLEHKSLTCTVLRLK